MKLLKFQKMKEMGGGEEKNAVKVIYPKLWGPDYNLLGIKKRNFYKT